jgi:spermidine/putrescine ABC transporter ATP-binding subunit
MVDQAQANRSPSIELRLEGITKRFGSTVAVDDIDLVVQPGKLTALLGPSGCGKSTTLRIIAGFEGPDAGRVLLDGHDVVSVPPGRRNLGMVFQDYSLFPHMTVRGNVSFGLRMARQPRAEIERRVKDILSLVKLDGLEDRYPNQISGGQQQRTALARSLVMRPSILLLDEPLGALDKNLREIMQFELRRIQQDLGITTVLVTHDQEEALTLADEIVVMNQGRILQIGSPHEVYEFPRTRFVSEFLGTANMLDVRVTTALPDGSGVGTLASAICENRIRVPHAAGDQECRIGIRPEKTYVSKDKTDKMENYAKATIDGVVFRGMYVAYSVSLNGIDRKLFVYEQAETRKGGARFRAGDAVWIGWDSESSFVVS